MAPMSMQASHGVDPMGLGRRYWSWYALTQLQIVRCAEEMSALMAGPTAGEWTTTERGALLLVSGCRLCT